MTFTTFFLLFSDFYNILFFNWLPTFDEKILLSGSYCNFAKKLLGFVFSFLAETLAETGSGFNEYGFETLVFLLIFLYGCIQCRWTFRSSPICRIVDPFLPLLILNFHFLCLNRSWTFLTFHNVDKKPWRLRRGGGRGKLIFLKIDTGPGTSIIMCAC